MTKKYYIEEQVSNRNYTEFNWELVGEAHATLEAAVAADGLTGGPLLRPPWRDADAEDMAFYGDRIKQNEKLVKIGRDRKRGRTYRIVEVAK
ncbi:MAG TPA: hypothetical protein VM581_04710 [Magnetospirillaceae bacterium]|nr:hypothetical protein [Magnetospirillaceae bacterium]